MKRLAVFAAAVAVAFAFAGWTWDEDHPVVRVEGSTIIA